MDCEKPPVQVSPVNLSSSADRGRWPTPCTGCEGRHFCIIEPLAKGTVKDHYVVLKRCVPCGPRHAGSESHGCTITTGPDGRKQYLYIKPGRFKLVQMSEKAVKDIKIQNDTQRRKRHAEVCSLASVLEADRSWSRSRVTTTRHRRSAVARIMQTMNATLRRLPPPHGALMLGPTPNSVARTTDIVLTASDATAVTTTRGILIAPVASRNASSSLSAATHHPARRLAGGRPSITLETEDHGLRTSSATRELICRAVRARRPPHAVAHPLFPLLVPPKVTFVARWRSRSPRLHPTTPLARPLPVRWKWRHCYKRSKTISTAWLLNLVLPKHPRRTELKPPKPKVQRRFRHLLNTRR